MSDSPPAVEDGTKDEREERWRDDGTTVRRTDGGERGEKCMRMEGRKGMQVEERPIV